MIVDSFTYMNQGEYYVGYTVVFGKGSGCEGMTFQGYKLVWYDDGSKSCDVVDDESVSSSENLLFSLFYLVHFLTLWTLHSHFSIRQILIRFQL